MALSPISDTLRDHIRLFESVGALSASASYTSQWLSLADFQYLDFVIAAKHGVASAGESLVIEVSTNQSDFIMPALARGGNNSGASNSTSAQYMFMAGEIQGNFFRVNYTNGSTAQTALGIYLAIIP